VKRFAKAQWSRPMTTITIDLSDDFAVRLSQQARTLKTSINELAEAFVVRGIEDEEQVGQGWHPSLTPDDIAAIEEGMAQAKRGEVYSLDEVLATLDQTP
jgi:predicted transcriptional regulator